MTGKSNVWPVKASIRPDIVRWPAVIFSPGLLQILYKSSFVLSSQLKYNIEKLNLLIQ